MSQEPLVGTLGWRRPPPARSELDSRQLCDALDQSEALVVLLDAEGHIVHLNRACAQVLGGDDELLGKNFFALLLPGQPGLGRARWQAITQGPWPYRDEEHVGTTGRSRIWTWSPAALEDEAGRSWLGVALERESTSNLLTRDLIWAFEHTHGPLALLDRGFRFICVNAAYAAGCQYSKEELLGRSHFELFPNAENQAVFERVRETGEPYFTTAKSFVYPRDPARGVTWWNWSLIPLKNESGQTERLLLSLFEITELVQARERSAQLAAELEAVFAGMTEGVFVYDAKGVVLYANPSVQAIFGFDPTGEHYGQIFSRVALRHGNDHEMPAEQMPVARTLRSGQVINDRVKITRPDGVRTLLVCSSPLRVGDELTGVVVVWTDITEREELLARERALRAEAESAAELRERFVAILGHDLRNPLSSILLSTESLLRAGLDEARAKPVKRIALSAKRMRAMIQDILDFARGRSGQFPVVRTPADLRRICTEVVDEVRAAHPNRQIELETSGDCTGFFDQQRIGQVVANLLTNALVHGAAAPVQVRLVGREDCVQLAVTNQGEPLPPANIPSLFEPFRRAVAAHGAPQGLGLGLFIVREIVRAHGGTIEVHSSREEGTTFAVCLPRSTPAPAA